jgi:hypothetical protein
MELYDLFALAADRRAAREREAAAERVRPRRVRPVAAKPAKRAWAHLAHGVRPAR